MYRRMLEAMQLLDAEPASQVEGEPELVLKGTHLRDALLKGFDPSCPDSQTDASQLDKGAFSDDPRISSWARRYRSEIPQVEEGDPQLPLNPTQVRAIALMLSERLSLVQGVRPQCLRVT